MSSVIAEDLFKYKHKRMEHLYYDFGTWMKEQFPYKVQKISIDAGFTCPNRDGLLGRGGCTYCNNNSFNPGYCNTKKNISEQLEEGKHFFSKKYPTMKYLAYFQAYTNTYADIDTLKNMYEKALSVDDVVGIVIGTRPDCMPESLLDYLEKLNRRTFLLVEYGIETANDNTLKRINRGHNFQCSKDAIKRTKDRGIKVGAHIIIGLPGEDTNESIKQAPLISALDIDILKIHQMQIIKGTQLALEFQKSPFHLYSLDEYIDTISQYIQYLRRDLVIERFVSQSPPDLLIAPQWGLKNYEFTNLLNKELKRRGITQGCKAE